MDKLHSFNEIFDGQAVFRALLTAMSNPGRIVSVRQQAEKLYGDFDSFLALAITLLDNEVTFCTCDNEDLQKEIALLTLSKYEDVEHADYIFVDRAEKLPEIIMKAKCGTLADPQNSATLLIRTAIHGDCKLTMYGAGIDGKMNLSVSETIKKSMMLRDEQMYEYPQGIDLIFVSDMGEILCIPRLVLQKEEL